MTTEAMAGLRSRFRYAWCSRKRQIAVTNYNVLRTEQRPIAIDNYAAVRSTPVILTFSDRWQQRPCGGGCIARNPTPTLDPLPPLGVSLS